MLALGAVCVCGSRSVVVCAPYTCPTTPTADVAAAVTTLRTSCPALSPTLRCAPYRPRSWCCRCCCSYSRADASCCCHCHLAYVPSHTRSCSSAAASCATAVVAGCMHALSLPPLSLDACACPLAGPWFTCARPALISVCSTLPVKA